MAEAEVVVNSRPLTVETISNVTRPLPLSPSNLLTMKSNIVMPPPGRFESPDLYTRKWWRRVQHIVNEFWSRWHKEFLGSLQERQKRNKIIRNFQVGDIVLLKEEQQPRNSWPMVRVVGTEPDNNGVVWSIQFRMGNSKINKMFRRPISKLILLIDNPKNE